LSGGAAPLAPWRWIGLPMIQALGATVLLLVPVRVFGLQLPEPVFAMVPAFAWAVIRPSLLAPAALLLMGACMDLVWGSPLGLWSLCLLLAYGAALSVRSILAGQSRPVMWAWYAIACLVAEGAGFLFIQLDSQSTPSLIAVGWQLLATILLYPFADRLIDRFEDADVRFR
jgi:rod shape-determining protein MreD